MSPESKRRQAIPRLVRPSGPHGLQTVKLDRRPFNREDIDEGWLQTLLHEHPDLLAVEEIEADYGPLVSIGREINAGSGSIDNLYVNPDGQITIAEAKLWKNPEARRTVVGQILEYANRVATWTYDDLNNRCKVATTRSLYEHICREQPELTMLEEDEFVDAVTRNLRRGRFLLLVVGDGIKENAIELAGVLQASPGLRFTLALLELRVFDFPGTEDMLVVPSVVARTQEIVRSVVEVRAEHGAVRVSTESDTGNPVRIGSRGASSPDAITRNEFVAFMHKHGGPATAADAERLLSEIDLRKLTVETTASNLIIKLPDPNESGKFFTLFGINKGGDMWVNRLPEQTIAAGIEYDGSPAEAFLTTLSRLLGRELRLQRGKKAPDYWGKNIPFTAVRPHLGELLETLDIFLDAIGRPRPDTR